MKQLIVKNREIGTGKPLICVPVMETEKEAIISEIESLSQSAADMMEWRADAFEHFFDENAVRDVLKAVRPMVKEKLFLYTFRTKSQGGEAEIDSGLLRRLHFLAAESGCVDLVDLEYFREENPNPHIVRLQEMGVKVIASHHDFQKTPAPEKMKMLLESMRAGGADIVKLAVMPETARDVLNLLEVTENFKREHPETPVITMSMGGLGSISRLCGEVFGSCVTFGAHQKCSAPGQYQMQELAAALDMLHKSMNTAL